MVGLVEVEQSVAFLEGELDFGGAPCAGESALAVGLLAVVDGLVEKRCDAVLTDTGGAEREGEFLAASVGQD